MEVYPEDITQFKKIWQEEFGEEIDDACALEEAQRLLSLMSFACAPIPEDKLKEYEKFKQMLPQGVDVAGKNRIEAPKT